MRLGACAPGATRGKQPIGTEIELTFPTILGENNHGQTRAVKGVGARRTLARAEPLPAREDRLRIRAFRLGRSTCCMRGELGGGGEGFAAGRLMFAELGDALPAEPTADASRCGAVKIMKIYRFVGTDMSLVGKLRR